MAEPLKYIYNQDFFNDFTAVLKGVIPDFDESAFLNTIYDDSWEQRELKQRMQHIIRVLKRHLPEDYEKGVSVLLEIVRQLQREGFGEPEFAFMFFPDFMARYGLKHYKTSVDAFEHVTQFTSCEFAVRPFIMAYPQQMMTQMLRWSTHKHPMVRRLSSEGCRPRLPWAMALPELKKNPEPVIPILENLKNDDSESVRRSVANNLNDIAKDHPDTVIALAKSWQGMTKHTDWVIKHGCRT
ncbi:MAG: DNA alkylation repair protein, partial [Bacteroidota bacterium]